jgi:ABC-2 type transport system permease protein
MADATMAGTTNAARVTGETAIHDLGYRRYEGSREGPWGAWRALFWHGFRATWGLGRGAKSKVVPVLATGITMIPAIGMTATAIMSMGAIKLQYGRVIESGLIMLVLFTGAQAPETLSRDQQHRVLPLLLTRDVTRTAYATARWASIVVSVFLMAFAPLLIAYLGDILAATDVAARFRENGARIFPILVQAATSALAIGGVGAALAAWTPRRAYATAAIIGVFLVSAAIGDALENLAGVSRHVKDFMNIPVSLHTQARLFFDERTRRMDRFPPLSLGTHLAYFTALGLAGLAALVVRIRRVRA